MILMPPRSHGLFLFLFLFIYLYLFIYSRGVNVVPHVGGVADLVPIIIVIIMSMIMITTLPLYRVTIIIMIIMIRIMITTLLLHSDP